MKFDNQSQGINYEICQSIGGEEIVNLVIRSQQHIMKFVNRPCKKKKKIGKFIQQLHEISCWDKSGNSAVTPTVGKKIAKVINQSQENIVKFVDWL